jgi:hypothetical protein
MHRSAVNLLFSLFPSGLTFPTASTAASQSPAVTTPSLASPVVETGAGEDAARGSLQATLDNILSIVCNHHDGAAAAAGSKLSLEVVREPPLSPCGGMTHVVFFALGFLSEGKTSDDALAGLLSATDASRVAVVRVVWDAGDPAEVIAAVTAAQACSQSLPLGEGRGALLKVLSRAATIGGAGASQAWSEFNFHAKHAQARAVGSVFGACLERFIDTLCDVKIILMGHSLGARIVLHALSVLGSPRSFGGGSVSREAFVEACVLFAAAQAGPETKPHVWESALPALRGQLFNIFNRHDVVLKYALGVGMKVAAVDVLTLRAPAGARSVSFTHHHANIPSRLVNIDASDMLRQAPRGGHSYHDYIDPLLRDSRLSCLGIL